MRKFYFFLTLTLLYFSGSNAPAQQPECYKIIHIDRISFKDYNFITLQNYAEDTLYLMTSKAGKREEGSAIYDSLVPGKCYQLNLERKDSLFAVDLSERLTRISIREIETCFKTLFRDHKMLIPVYFTEQVQDLYAKRITPETPDICGCSLDSTDFSRTQPDVSTSCALTADIAGSIEKVKSSPKEFIKSYRTNGSCMYNFLDTLATLFITTYDPQYIECIDQISTVSYGILSEDVVTVCKRIYSQRFIQFYSYLYDRRNMACRSTLDQKFIEALVQEMGNRSTWTELKISFYKQLDEGKFSDRQKNYFNHMVQVAEILSERM